ncbi:MAG: NAD-dependent epimerase/dehydratase family protein [Deltaproteobacteria bacterium]|nr:NAD-dependent epimerase/dehydratase family protein [Deltaproteobacteria bacterium]
MRILITGGAGFIGSHVADACLAAGHEVVILDDLSTGRRENIPTAAVFAEGDIREEGFVRDILTGFRPEIVCHQAAQTSVSISAREPLLDADINIMGTLNLLSLAWQPRPLSPYACSKFAVENYLVAFAAEHDLRSTVLRYSNVYGPRQDPHGEAGVVAIFSQRALERQPISVFARESEGDAGCVRDYVYVKDVVRANLAAIDDTIGLPMINVCTGVATSTLDLAKSIVQLAGSETEIVYGPRRVGDVERSVLDPGEPPPLGESIALEDGLRSTLAWFERTSAA